MFKLLMVYAPKPIHITCALNKGPPDADVHDAVLVSAMHNPGFNHAKSQKQKSPNTDSGQVAYSVGSLRLRGYSAMAPASSDRPDRLGISKRWCTRIT